MYLSVLTVAEIRKGIAVLQVSRRRAWLENWLETALLPQFIGRILSIDLPIAERWAVMLVSAKTSGRPLPIVDSLVAATALHHNLTLVTRNTADVEPTGVRILNPWA